MRDIVNATKKVNTKVRLSIYDGDNWISFGDNADYGRLYSVSLDNSIDNSGWNLEARFRNHPELESLDPYYHGTFQDLLDQYHKSKLEISKDDGNNWYTVFEGYSSETSPEKRVDKDDTVIYRPNDPSKRLKDRVIPYDIADWDSSLSYKYIDAFDAVDDILSAAGLDESINRTLSDNPKKTIYGEKPYEPRGTTVWEAITNIFKETGYNVTYRINPSTQTMDLVIIDPSHGLVSSGRATSDDWDETFIENNFRIFDGDFSRRDLSINDKEVRTKAKVWYQDRDTGQQDYVVVKDDDNPYMITSSPEDLHRENILHEPDDSLIDKESEATALANINLSDLKTPSPNASFDLEYFFPNAQIHDIYRFGGTEDYTVDISVTDIQHTINVERQIGTTNISGAVDRVIGKREYWLNRGIDNDEDIRQRGDGRAPHKPDRAPGLSKEIYATSDGQTVADVACVGKHAPEFDIIRYDWKHRIYRNGSWSNWKRDPSTGKDSPTTTLTGLPVGKDIKLQVKYAPVDRQSAETGGISSWSPAQTVLLTGDKTPPGLPKNISAEGGPGRIDLSWDLPTIDGDGTSLTDLGHINIYWDTTTPDPQSDTTKKVETSGNDWTFNATDTFEYHFRLSSVDNSGNESALTDEVIASADSVPSGDGYKPSTPSGLSLTDRITLQDDGTAVGKIKASWDEVTTNVNGDTTDDVAGYEVGLSTDNSNWDIKSDTNSPEDLITGLNVGETYYVRVRSYDYEDKYSDWSSSISQTISSDDTIPNSPVLDKVRPHPESIYVKWTKPNNNTDGSDITDFSHCLVYHSTSSGIDINDDLTYDDTQKIDGEHWIHEDLNVDTTRYYKITAVDNSGNESSASSENYAVPRINVGDHTVPSTPTNLSINSNTIDHQEDGTVYAIIKLEWDDNTESDLKGYEVAVSTDNTNWDVFSSTESSEDTIKPLKPNTDYYFRIRAVDTEQNKSNWTSSVSTTTDRDTTPPPEPSWSSTAVEEKPGQIVFHWQDVGVNDLRIYKIAVDQGNDGTFENIYQVKGTDFTVYGAYDTVYGAKVKAIDTSGNESSYTSTVQTGTANKTDTGDIAANAVDTNQLNANAVNADKVQADSMTLGEMNFSSDDSFVDQSVLKIGGSVTFIEGYDSSDFRTVIRQSSEPSERPSGDPLQEGDVWIDTDTNVQYTYDASSSSFVQNKVGAGNIIIRQDSEPTSRPDGDALKSGDMWIDTDDGDKPYTYNGSSFIESYTIINGGNIETGTITASEISAESQLTIGDGTNNNGYIESENFDGTATDPFNNPGSTGWAISAIGDAAFNNLYVRGRLEGVDGLIVENRTSDPSSPDTGRLWIRTDL